jgi:hypothetical protein
MNREDRAVRIEDLALRFDRHAEQNDARADWFRVWAVQKRREADEHPGSDFLQERADGLTQVVAYWKERASWAREMASGFRHKAEALRSKSSRRP